MVCYNFKILKFKITTTFFDCFYSGQALTHFLVKSGFVNMGAEVNRDLILSKAAWACSDQVNVFFIDNTSVIGETSDEKF